MGTQCSEVTWSVLNIKTLDTDWLDLHLIIKKRGDNLNVISLNIWNLKANDSRNKAINSFPVELELDKTDPAAHFMNTLILYFTITPR